MKQILQLTPLHPVLQRDLPKYFNVIDASNAQTREQVIQAKGHLVDGVLGAYNFPFKNEWLDFMPNLKVISSFGVGYDVYDLAELSRRGIVLSNTPSVLNDAVADIAIGLLLNASRGLVQADQWIRQGHWEAGKAFPLMRDVHHKKVGIVGLGSIGQVIAKRLTGFDAEIRYNSRRPKDVPYVFEPSVLELAKWADILILITVGGEQTRHLINKEVIHALGSNGVLINVARGSVVDQESLIEALEQGKLGAAGLDVYDNEPFVPQRLRVLPNVVMSPHIASATQECREVMAHLVLDNLLGFFEKGELKTPVPMP